MKKILLYATALLMGAGMLASCSDDNDELTDSRLTNYVVLEMQGDDFVIVPLGATYTDAGCKATMAGEDAASRLVTKSDVDVNEVGFYTVTYSAKNDDGFAQTVSRTVCVYDPEAEVDISGVYDADMEQSIYLNNGKTYADRAEYYGKTAQCTGITFEQFLPGIFYCSDLFGGWYSQIRGYGDGYAMTGYISVDGEGNIKLLDSYTPSWGDSLDYIEDAVYDSEAKTIGFSLSYAGQIFMAPVLKWVAPLPEEEE